MHLMFKSLNKNDKGKQVQAALDQLELQQQHLKLSYLVLNRGKNTHASQHHFHLLVIDDGV